MVTHIDWKRRHVFVESTKISGMARWMSIPDGASFEIARGVRQVLFGNLPSGVTLTKRAQSTLSEYRDVRESDVSEGSFVISRDDKGDWKWWTWAGAKANRSLVAWATDLAPPRQRTSPESIRLHRDLTISDLKEGLAELRGRSDRPLPAIDKRALKGLKFSAALPEELARRTLAARSVDPVHAEVALGDRVSFLR